MSLDDLFTPGPTRVVGIVNVTADSFSDGGQYLDQSWAVAHGLSLAREGAALVDVGGESTRPGAEPVTAEAELARVLPVIEGLVAQGVAVSIDTTKAVVAEAAIQAGAVVINDVSGGLADPDMLDLAAARDVGLILQHWRGWLDRDGSPAQYGDVVEDVLADLAGRVAAATAAGVSRDRLILDPGLGFSKTFDHNWALLRAAARFNDLGLPVLWGASRKRFLSEVYNHQTEPFDRDGASVAVAVRLAQAGVWGVRVHAVRGTVAAIRASERIG